MKYSWITKKRLGSLKLFSHVLRKMERVHMQIEAAMDEAHTEKTRLQDQVKVQDESLEFLATEMNAIRLAKDKVSQFFIEIT